LDRYPLKAFQREWFIIGKKFVHGHIIGQGENWMSKLNNTGCEKIMETRVKYNMTQEELKKLHGKQV
jgi:hypothetical protein